MTNEIEDRITISFKDFPSPIEIRFNFTNKDYYLSNTFAEI